MSDEHASVDVLSEALTRADWSVEPPGDATRVIRQRVATRRRKRRHALVRSIAAVVAIAVLVPATYHSWTDRHALLEPTGHVHLPPAKATPRQVTIAYIEAISMHDAATARALVTGANMPSATTYYLQKLAHVDTFRITRVSGDDPSYAGGVDVVITWNLAWVNQDYLDKDGPQVWGFILIPNQQTGRWLIIDEGTG